MRNYINKMKLPAVVLAAILSAAPAFAGGWSETTQFGAGWTNGLNTAKLASIEFPAAPAPAKAAPRDGQNYSGAEELLIKEFAVTRVSLDIPEAEVMRQDRFYDNAFCFEQALRLALNNLLEDYKSPTSPLARVLSEMGVLSKPSRSDLKTARQKVMSLLDAPASRLSLVRPYKQNQPQNGEAVEKNWIFFLRLDGTPYWAIVDRSGEKPAYAYGLAAPLP
jgi:hypothetical protein